MFTIQVTIKLANSGSTITLKKGTIPESIVKNRYDLCGLIARGLLFSKGFSHSTDWEWDVVKEEE